MQNKIKFKVVHIITSLANGGAEGVLFRLCSHDSVHHHIVFSLQDEGKYEPLLRAHGIEVHTVGMRPNIPSPIALLTLIRLLRKHRPDIVQTWMYHADLIGGIAARMAGIRSIVWGIRHTTLEPGKSKKTTIWIAKLLAKLSWWLPVRIAVCAQRAMDVHEALGYNRAIMRFIANGYDLADFTPKPEAARALRAEWVVEPNMPLIGTVGRYDPQKDHANLLQALALLRSRNIPVRCVLVGTSLDDDNQELLAQIQGLGFEETVILLGSRTDIRAIMSALDVHVLPSAYGEAFPNVVAEAMACETPCVVTDVGDAAYIVGDTGWVVPTRDAEALAGAMEKALIASQQTDWQERCVLARKRIAEQFSIQRMVSAYSALWNEVVA
jgi:glycosyltransferase involved in cell wall biosynthesis